MSREELEAEQSLATLSQVTNYIFQWQDKKIKKPHHNHIKEERDEEQIQHTPVVKRPKEQRKIPVIKEVSQKYDLKKWERRAQAINKIQFPVFDLQAFQQRYVRSKYKISIGPSLNERDGNVERKQSINKKIIEAVKNQYMMKKLQKFQKKLQSSKKNLFKQESAMRELKYIPKNLVGRRITSLEKDKSQEQLKKRISNKSQIQKFKKELDKNRRKFSLPNLFKF